MINWWDKRTKTVWRLTRGGAVSYWTSIEDAREEYGPLDGVEIERIEVQGND